MQEAEQILRDVIEFAPEEAKAWAWLGKILLLQQQREEAGNCFKRAESLLSRNLSKKIAPETPVSKPLAKIFWQQGDTDTALEMLSVLLLKNPGDDELKSWQKSWATGSNA